MAGALDYYRGRYRGAAAAKMEGSAVKRGVKSQEEVEEKVAWGL